MATISRRNLLGSAVATSCLGGLPLGLRLAAASPDPGNSGVLRRVRPSDPSWPSAQTWEDLNGQVGGRLVKVASPTALCQGSPQEASCRDLFRELKNPYYIRDAVALTQTTGWVDAWTSTPSAYAVAATGTADVVAAVNFARRHRLRLVVKGGGHSYLGTSNAPDSLLIWMRPMTGIALRDDFVAEGCSGPGEPAATIEAGAIWMHAYNAVTTRRGRYIQGGGCGTVGVAGLVQGGGFGTYSKAYGTAAAALLEAEVVTADGIVRTANRCVNPDLFWALKGGGGGTFGLVTRMTLRTRELPNFVGLVAAKIKATSDVSFRRLLGRFVAFYADELLNAHWGEIVNVRPDRILDIHLEFQGMDQQQAADVWRSFFSSITDAKDEFEYVFDPVIRHIPAAKRWDAAFLNEVAPGSVIKDDRDGAPAENVFWGGNLSEAGHFIHGFESVWLPVSLLRADKQAHLVDVLLAASRHTTVEIHFQKGMAGASAETLATVRETSMNPAVLDAFALAIVGSEGPPAFPGLPGHEPDMANARRSAKRVARAADELRQAAPSMGSYVAESGYFEPDWKRSYWGSNYPRLLAVKKKFDPDGLFFVHHGVGSEDWSEDGFTKIDRPDRT